MDLGGSVNKTRMQKVTSQKASQFVPFKKQTPVEMITTWDEMGGIRTSNTRG